MSQLIILLAEMGSIERTVITVLAVAGGFTFGFLGTGGAARIFGLTAPGQPPGAPLRFTKFGGGAAGALGVYLLISGAGGLGLGGSGEGTSLNQDGKNQAKVDPQVESKKKEDPKTKNKDEDLRGTPLSVYVLGVEAMNNRNFRFEDETDPLTDEQIIERIENLEKSGQLKSKQIRVKAGAENMSVPQYGKIYSKLRSTFEPRGFEIIPLRKEGS